MKFYDWNSWNRLVEIERLAFFQTNDGFFPVVGAARISAAFGFGAAPAHANDDRGGKKRGTYLAGDFHNHTTCSDGALSLLDLLKADADVTARLAPEELDQLFDLGYHFKHVDTIFARVFG